MTQESKITVKSTQDGSSEVQVLRNSERAIIVRHTAHCPWVQLEEAVKIAQTEIFEDYKAEIDLLTLPRRPASECMTVTLSFWKGRDGGRMLVKKAERSQYAVNIDFTAQANSLLAKLPKMLYGLRKTHTSGKADTLMIAFEWLETMDQAPAKDIVHMLDRMRVEAQFPNMRKV